MTSYARGWGSCWVRILPRPRTAGRSHARASFGHLIAVLCFLVIAPCADARGTRHFAIAAGSLADALVAFASQADLSIAIDDPRLGSIRTRGISGDYDVPA